MKACSYPQHPTSIRRGVHCFDRIVEQVGDHQPQLTLMAVHERHFGRKFGVGRNAMILQLSVQRLQYFKYNPVDIDRQPALIGSAEQRTDTVEHFARAMAVTYNSIDDCSYLTKIEWRHSKKSSCRTTVCRNGSQGLAYFMSNRSRNRLNIQRFIISFAL